MKTFLQKLNNTKIAFSKKYILFFKKSILIFDGYMIAVATIMVSVILIISGSISFVLMREIDRANIPISSQVAYNYADTTIRCLSSINDITINASLDGRGVFDFNSTTFTNNTGFDINDLKCLNNSLFSGAVDIKDTKTSFSDTNTSHVNSPTSFYGGFKYSKKIDIADNNNTGYNGCVNIESYSKTVSGIPKKLFVVTGKVPCTGGVERVITKSY